MTEETRQKIEAEIAKLIAETGRINAETDKIRIEKAFYPMVVGASFAGALIALSATATKIFL